MCTQMYVQMLESGGLVPIVNLTQADHMQTKIKCAAILSRLSLHKQYYKQFEVSNRLSCPLTVPL